MKHIKMLALAAMALAAFMAFAGSASAAPTLTSPSGTEYTGALNSSLESGTSALLKAGFANITCTTSTVNGTVSTNNETHASGNISTLDFGNCGSAHVVTLANGSLTVDQNGTVTGFNSEVTTGITALGTSCIYGPKTGTDLGKLAGGTTAKLAISASLPLVKTVSGFGCASPASWTANYVVTTPDTLLVK